MVCYRNCFDGRESIIYLLEGVKLRQECEENVLCILSLTAFRSLTALPSFSSLCPCVWSPLFSRFTHNPSFCLSTPFTSPVSPPSFTTVRFYTGIVPVDQWWEKRVSQSHVASTTRVSHNHRHRAGNDVIRIVEFGLQPRMWSAVNLRLRDSRWWRPVIVDYQLNSFILWNPRIIGNW